jgi:hypothetical protein
MYPDKNKSMYKGNNIHHEMKKLGELLKIQNVSTKKKCHPCINVYMVIMMQTFIYSIKQNDRTILEEE